MVGRLYFLCTTVKKPVQLRKSTREATPHPHAVIDPKGAPVFVYYFNSINLNTQLLSLHIHHINHSREVHVNTAYFILLK